MSLALDYHHRADPRRERVLAVWSVRRDLERLSTGGGQEPNPDVAVSPYGLKALRLTPDGVFPFALQAVDPFTIATVTAR